MERCGDLGICNFVVGRHGFFMNIEEKDPSERGPGAPKELRQQAAHTWRRVLVIEVRRGMSMTNRKPHQCNDYPGHSMTCTIYSSPGLPCIAALALIKSGA